MRKTAGSIIAIFALATPHSAMAAFECSGTVSMSHVAVDGSVLVKSSWRNDYTQICNVLTSWKDVPPTVCAAWIAKMDAAVSLGRNVGVYYTDGSLTCATLPSYASAPAPYYVSLK